MRCRLVAPASCESRASTHNQATCADCEALPQQLLEQCLTVWGESVGDSEAPAYVTLVPPVVPPPPPVPLALAQGPQPGGL